MKIAFFTYPWAFQDPGGGEILLLKTKEILEQRGIAVKLFDPFRDNLKDFDILHIFSSFKDCLGIMECAHKLGIKVVLSPIYWSTLTKALGEYGGLRYKIKLVTKHIAKVIFPFIPSGRRRMFLLADALLPNSELEAEQLIRLFALNKKKMHVVLLGVEERFAQAKPDEFINTYGIKDFILSVGRIEPRKNQLNLIKAMKGSGLKLVFIGSPVSGYEDYYAECKRIADKSVVFLNRLEHTLSLLASAYAACSVFVLQGWFETPGLAALEAGLAGAKLAVTKHGATSEYFKDYVEYFNPANPANIRSAIKRALAREKDTILKAHIQQNFLWSCVAEENIRVYKDLLQQ